MVLPLRRRQLRERPSPGEEISPFWPQLRMVLGQAVDIRAHGSHHQDGQEEGVLLVRHRRRRVLPQPTSRATNGSVGGKRRLRGHRGEHPPPRWRHRRVHHRTRAGGTSHRRAQLPLPFGTLEIDLGIEHGRSDLVRVRSSRRQRNLQVDQQSYNSIWWPLRVGRSHKIYFLALLPISPVPDQMSDS